MTQKNIYKTQKQKKKNTNLTSSSLLFFAGARPPRPRSPGRVARRSRRSPRRQRIAERRWSERAENNEKPRRWGKDVSLCLWGVFFWCFLGVFLGGWDFCFVFGVCFFCFGSFLVFLVCFFFWYGFWEFFEGLFYDGGCTYIVVF